MSNVEMCRMYMAIVSRPTSSSLPIPAISAPTRRTMTGRMFLSSTTGKDAKVQNIDSVAVYDKQ